MKTLSITEAKTHFSRMVRDVERGETFVITRHGTAVARIEPVQHDFPDAAKAIEEFRRYVRDNHIRLGGGITIRELIEEGRR